MAIVGPFHKVGHGCDDIIATVYVVHVQFVLCLVRSLVHDDIVEVAGDDTQLVGSGPGLSGTDPTPGCRKGCMEVPL